MVVALAYGNDSLMSQELHLVCIEIFFTDILSQKNWRLKFARLWVKPTSIPGCSIAMPTLPLRSLGLSRKQALVMLALGLPPILIPGRMWDWSYSGIVIEVSPLTD